MAPISLESWRLEVGTSENLRNDTPSETQLSTRSLTEVLHNNLERHYGPAFSTDAHEDTTSIDRL